ncbi:iron-siderophore ABC transporter substrate-binding protein [Brevibacillus borstelensis]|uniref:ABC transporter substrate-binding protein n=1 Tax=Brevibacillus borstelensis TaxID=45462 RepID=UPI002E1AAED0|nr:iron-siderophore ABC transporter substrate-binding protein [Brevibacillus borstelensis]
MSAIHKPSWQLLIAAALSLMLLVTGCSGGQNNTGSQPAQSQGQDQAAATDTKSDIRKVKHAMGEAEIKGTPERVVVLTSEGTEALLGLGVKPVGAVQSPRGNPWHDHIKDKMQDVTVLGDEAQPNIELIASLKPGLILGNKVRHEKVYSQLSGIAPTVFSEDLAGKWKPNFMLYAEALGKKADGEKLLADFDKKVEEAKAKLGDKTKAKVSLIRFQPGKIRLYMKDTFAGVMLSQLGFARPASQDKDEFMQVIAKEQLADADGDVLFYWVSDHGEKKEGSKYREEVMNDPLWKNLNVVKNNKVFEVNDVVWNIGGSILSAELLLDDILKRFDVK